REAGLSVNVARAANRTSIAGIINTLDEEFVTSKARGSREGDRHIAAGGVSKDYRVAPTNGVVAGFCGGSVGVVCGRPGRDPARDTQRLASATNCNFHQLAERVTIIYVTGCATAIIDKRYFL